MKQRYMFHLVVMVQLLSRVQLLRPHGTQPARLLCPWDFPGKNTGVDCHFLLQGIFSTKESNPGLLHFRHILYRLSYEGSPCFIYQTPKAFDCVDHNKLWKALKEMVISVHLTCLLRNLCAGQEATSQNQTQNQTQNGSKLGKQHNKVAYCHPAYLTYMQSASCEILGCMNHKLDS